jgi:hypothetical protein
MVASIWRASFDDDVPARVLASEGAHPEVARPVDGGEGRWKQDVGVPVAVEGGPLVRTAGADQVLGHSLSMPAPVPRSSGIAPARDDGGVSAMLGVWSTCPECRGRRWTG